MKYLFMICFVYSSVLFAKEHCPDGTRIKKEKLDSNGMYVLCQSKKIFILTGGGINGSKLAPEAIEIGVDGKNGVDWENLNNHEFKFNDHVQCHPNIDGTLTCPDGIYVKSSKIQDQVRTINRKIQKKIETPNKKDSAVKE